METRADFKIFALKRVAPSWGGIVARIGHDIEEPLKTDGLHAVSIFRKVLGEHFFTDEGVNHPLQSKWANVVAWQIAQLSEWANVIEQLHQSSEDVMYLSELLRQRKKCQQEGIHFLRIASSLLRAGFKLKFIRSKHDSKSPDIEVREPNTGEVFYFEVTHLEKNAVFQQDERNYRDISNASLPFTFNLLTSVQLLRSLKEDELTTAVSMITHTASQAYQQNCLQVARTEFIDIAFAPLTDGRAFEAWLLAEDRRKGINGVSVNPDETARITQRGRIERKMKQFPDGATGVIYIGVEFLYFLYMDRKSVLAAIKQAMSRHAQLKGIVLCCDVIDPCDNAFEEFPGCEDLYSVHSAHGHTTLYLYCVNDHYKGDISGPVLDQFRTSFIPAN